MGETNLVGKAVHDAEDVVKRRVEIADNGPAKSPAGVDRLGDGSPWCERHRGKEEHVESLEAWYVAC